MSEMNGKQVYDNFKQGRGTESLRSAAEELMKLQGTYKERAGSMKSIQGEMSEAWKGDASAQARSGINPVMSALEDSAGYMDQTTNSMVDQTTEWHRADASVVPVPDKPDKPSGWSVFGKSMIPVVGPSMAKGDVDNYRDGMKEHNEAAEQNVQVMNGYDNNTTANSNFPTDYGTLERFGSDIKGVKEDQPDSVGRIPGSDDGGSSVNPNAVNGQYGRGDTSGSGGADPSSGGDQYLRNAGMNDAAGPNGTPGPGGTSTPGGDSVGSGTSGDIGSPPAAQTDTDTSTSSSSFTPNAPGSGGGADGSGHGNSEFGPRGTGRPGAPGAGNGPGGHVGGGAFGPSNPGGSGDSAGRGSGRPGGGTGAPGSGVRGGAGSGSGGTGSGSGSGTGGVRGGAGSGGAGSGAVRGGGLNSGGGSAGGTGSGASSGAEPRPGATSGAARGGSTAGEGGYGSSAAGSGSGGGARGAGGMRGGMPIGGAGAGRGSGDEEHEKKTEVLENHPESLFVGDLPKTTPPVIGE